MISYYELGSDFQFILLLIFIYGQKAVLIHVGRSGDGSDNFFVCDYRNSSSSQSCLYLCAKFEITGDGGEFGERRNGNGV